jgi:hypothetical protein
MKDLSTGNASMVLTLRNKNVCLTNDDNERTIMAVSGQKKPLSRADGKRTRGQEKGEKHPSQIKQHTNKKHCVFKVLLLTLERFSVVPQ